jgi:hypothetical protein
MSEKTVIRAGVGGPPEADPEQVRSDLETCGIDPEFARRVSERLVAIVQDLSTHEYAALLDGVSSAYGVHRKANGSNGAQFQHGNELQRLMEGFTGELRKLDEGLQILSAYLVRMGALWSGESSQTPR